MSFVTPDTVSPVLAAFVFVIDAPPALTVNAFVAPPTVKPVPAAQRKLALLLRMPDAPANVTSPLVRPLSVIEVVPTTVAPVTDVTAERDVFELISPVPVVVMLPLPVVILPFVAFKPVEVIAPV